MINFKIGRGLKIPPYKMGRAYGTLLDCLFFWFFLCGGRGIKIPPYNMGRAYGTLLDCVFLGF
jgi:hypothetical protein